MDESTTTDPATTGPEPDAGTNAGTTPEPPQEPPKSDAKSFDEGYVKALRKEAAGARTKLAETESQLRELQDRDKSESEKLTARATESERRAVEAEAKLLRVEVAASRNFQASAVPLLHGTTREEIEASADALEAFAKTTTPTAPGFDGGARQTPDATKTPEEAHNELLLRMIGRVP